MKNKNESHWKNMAEKRGDEESQKDPGGIVVADCEIQYKR